MCRRNTLYSLLFISLFLSGTDTIFAQTKQVKLDSLYKQFKKDSTWIYRPRKVFPLVAIDQRNSFLKTGNTNSPVNIWGAKAGITLFDRHNMGIGGYSIQNSSTRQRIRDNATIDQNLTFQYLTVFYEYSFIETKWWEVGIPVEAGYGFYRVTSVVENTSQHLPNRYGNVIPLGTALDIYFKPTRWFGINVMGGYRYVINNNSRLNLNGWFYSIGAAIYIRQIVQDSRYFFKKKNYKREIEKINLSAY
ncbi:MAG TPA: hypothetical protein VNZ49_08195 [Bacteroidia bacterium]|jgi:hypothetical protein|nr:hypothetical protein [Bacteroidia bacterium]